ncbi:hypothetical protein E6O75_ATG09725 [Venturia nashicola]|uniref:Uncharacterized protein n=1 Tax=Venturia nashicola TaxID=86259 RepID=A0A4Z1NM65_9PEZI|nr:hypothetical protein E6O75_ATG09725 [Venturia nashicola]
MSNTLPSFSQLPQPIVHTQSQLAVAFLHPAAFNNHLSLHIHSLSIPNSHHVRHEPPSRVFDIRQHLRGIHSHWRLSNAKQRPVGVTQEAINQSRLDTDMLYDIDTICVKNTDTLVFRATPEFQ